MDLKKQAAQKAVTLIREESRIGLGAGSTMAFMVDLLKDSVEAGFPIEVASSSQTTRKLLYHAKIPVLEMAELDHLDQYFDGCDQVEKNLHALKSGAGIHTHEKLMASMANTFIIVADESKWVDRFDESIPLVVEVLPEAISFVQKELGMIFEFSEMAIRFDTETERPHKTVNGNLLLDMWFKQWNSLVAINVLTEHIPGVLETSLFYGMAEKAVLGSASGAFIVEKKKD
jgi:ribose 5-phosphate isomerase A